MKNAIVSAVVAALVASGSTYAATRINGRSIRLHSIPLNRLTHKPPRGQRGPTGPIGPKGDMGPQGPVGGLDPTSVSVVTGATETVPAGDAASAGAFCPSGQVAIGGGGATPGVPLTESTPETGVQSGWHIVASNTTQAPVSIQAYVVCVK